MIEYRNSKLEYERIRDEDIQVSDFIHANNKRCYPAKINNDDIELKENDFFKIDKTINNHHQPIQQQWGDEDIIATRNEPEQDENIQHIEFNKAQQKVIDTKFYSPYDDWQTEIIIKDYIIFQPDEMKGHLKHLQDEESKSLAKGYQEKEYITDEYRSDDIIFSTPENKLDHTHYDRRDNIWDEDLYP